MSAVAPPLPRTDPRSPAVAPWTVERLLLLHLADTERVAVQEAEDGPAQPDRADGDAIGLRS